MQPAVSLVKTTVQLHDDTKRLLKQLKEELNAPSYDKLINQLICKHEGIPESLFGKHPDLPSWNKRR